MDNNISLLVDAKKSYTNQLISFLYPHIYEGIESIFEDSVRENNSKNKFKNFQITLKKVPKWNQDIIDKETERILQVTNCDYIDKLLSAVFITNTKILTSVNINNINIANKIEVSIPILSHFIHKCYIESAREFYKNPFLFDKNNKAKERQSNLRESISIIKNSINESIRKLLPIREILNQFISKETKTESQEQINEMIENNQEILENLDNEISEDIESEKLENNNLEDINENILENVKKRKLMMKLLKLKKKKKIVQFQLVLMMKSKLQLEVI